MNNTMLRSAPVTVAVAAVLLLGGCTTTNDSAGATATPTQHATVTATATPVFGLASAWPSGAGFGAVKPQTVDRAGDGTSVMTEITWSSWGGAQATGTGTAVYVAPGEPLASGTEQPATIVAWDPGTCAGRLAYRAYAWYFPAHGQQLDKTKYFSACDTSHLGE